jgi:hypothetical protein
MNSFLSFFLSLLILSIISVQLTSSASFPNPPQFPPPNASADEWSLFWKLLHNFSFLFIRYSSIDLVNDMIQSSHHS